MVNSIGKDGSIKRTTTYLDEMNNKCKDVEKNGKLVSSSITNIGQRSKDMKNFTITLGETNRLLKTRSDLQIKILSLEKGSEEHKNATEKLNLLDRQIEKRKKNLKTLARTSEEQRKLNNLYKTEQEYRERYQDAERASSRKADTEAEKKLLAILSEKKRVMSEIYSAQVRLIQLGKNKEGEEGDALQSAKARLDLLDDQEKTLLEQNKELKQSEKYLKAHVEEERRRLTYEERITQEEEKRKQQLQQQERIYQNILAAISGIISVRA